MAAVLIGGEGFAVDASVIEADASRFHRVEGAEVMRLILQAFVHFANRD